MLGIDLWILARNYFEHPLPQTPSIGHRIGLVAQKHSASGTAIHPGFCFAIFESKPDDALDPFTRIDVLLHGQLVGSTLVRDSTAIDVDTLRVFQNTDEINVVGLPALQRT